MQQRLARTEILPDRLNLHERQHLSLLCKACHELLAVRDRSRTDQADHL